MATLTNMTHEASQQREVFREFMNAMRIHQTDLRLDINHVEAIVGCIAKSSDDDVVKHLPDTNLAISNLRECLSTFEAHRLTFEIDLGAVHDA
jgi:hypothetical protein